MKRDRSAYFKVFNQTPDRVSKRRIYAKKWAKDPHVIAQKKKYEAEHRLERNAIRKEQHRLARLARPPVVKKTAEEKRLIRLERERQNRIKDPAKYRAYNAKWRAANRDRERERGRKYRAETPEKSRMAARKYNLRNPIKSKIRCAERRARVLNATIGSRESIELWLSRWKRKRSVRCYWCQNYSSPKECHIDHVIALAKGGAHEVGNLCVSCSSCNQRKHALSVDEWNLRIQSPVLL